MRDRCQTPVCVVDEVLSPLQASRHLFVDIQHCLACVIQVDDPLIAVGQGYRALTAPHIRAIRLTVARGLIEVRVGSATPGRSASATLALNHLLTNTPLTVVLEEVVRVRRNA